MYEVMGPEDPTIKPWPSRTLGDMLDDISKNDRDAIVFRGGRYSYREFRAKVDLLARALMALGIAKGDKVAVWMTNRPEWIFAQFAIAKIGAVLVPLNTRYKLHEAEYILRQSDAVAVICLDEFRNIDYLSMLGQICPELNLVPPSSLRSTRLPELRHVIVLGKRSVGGAWSFGQILDMGKRVGARELRQRQSQVGVDDVAMILYTSGTTGLPKGAMLTHANIGANGWYQGEVQRITSNDRFIVHVPLFHCFGCVNAVLAAVPHQATQVLVETFEPEESLQTIAEERCTVVYGVPTMFIGLLQHPDFGRYDLSSLRTGIMSGAPCPVKVMEDVIERMGVREITITFGQTECSPVAAMTRRSDPIELRVQSVGCPIPGVECKVVDAKTGEDLSPGSQGEFCTRGHHVMRGYYKKPVETAAVIDKGGWLHTGDLVIMDEKGYFRTTGRLRDMYICGGFNVYPREIEDYLFRHPKIKQVQVIGIPDELMGEVGVAWIELKEGERCDVDQITGFCQRELANFKVPRYVRFVESWPMTATGKIQKFRLRELALQELRLEDPDIQAHA